jgi:primosomal protein N' (replication factor Y)
MTGKVKPGQLVEIPFGRQNVQGVIIDFPRIPAVPQTKAVHKILDPIPVVTPHQIELAGHISRETLSPLGITLTAMVPAGLSVQADVLYQLTERSLEDLDADRPLLAGPTPSQTRLLDILIKRGPLRGRQLDRALPHMNWRRTAGYLSRRGILETESSLADPSVQPKIERRLEFTGNHQLASDEMDRLAQKRFPEALSRRQAILTKIIESGEPLPLSSLYKETGANLADIKALIKRGLGELIEVPVFRDPLEGISVAESPPPVLTEDQSRVWNPIQSAIRQKESEIFLLQGVTGSGKTEIYLRAAEEAIAHGRQVIILVPEIALTPQTVTRFMSRFPDRVGVLHSELSPGERFDTWRLARHGALDIVVGPRSALFTPFPDPGLIVIDECHDDSYYQGDISPRYHAREAAIQYAKITGAVCVMGSATPDVTSSFWGTTGKYQCLSLPRRILAHKETIRKQLKQSRQDPGLSRYRDLDDQLQTADLPEVEIVDMRDELKRGNRSIFSQALQTSLEERLNRNQQAILFLNRRGSATYVFCRDCGYALRCPRCDTSLTAHLGAGEMRCHLCGYKRQIPKTCPECASKRIRQLGTGTQQVESVLKEHFPDVRTLRWDRDTTQTKGAHWEIMESFSSHKADVLIGTQMLAKGLDLPLVTLVGIVLADSGLHLPDFRAGERTFQILTQVAGRAGRSPLGGNVILQTFEPDHFVIQAAAGHDYDDFYQQELESRRELGYPPFLRLVRLEIRDQDSKKAEKKARAYSANLEGWIEVESYRSTRIVGPTPAYFNRLRGEWRWQILIKGPNPLALIRDHHPGAEWIVEVDPPVIL